MRYDIYRQFPWIGKYVTIFHDVLDTFLKVLVILIILVVGFALAFHILLTHMDEFSTPGNSMLKTLIMMSGEFDYGDIFFPENDENEKVRKSYQRQWIQILLYFIKALN